MKFRTLALALALACGLTAVAGAKTTKTVVKRQVKPRKVSKKFKAGKYKAPKRIAKKTAKR